MKTNCSKPLFAVSLGLLCQATFGQVDFRVEGFPEPQLTQLRNVESARRLAATSGKFTLHPSFVIQVTRRWQPGETIPVAFNGGDQKLRERIADAASEWCKYANLKLDFGEVTPSGRKFREWRTDDVSYSASIRVAFNQRGYWSYVGTDCTDASITPPSQASLNLERFDSSLPSDWKAVLLHEFGHALGFQHEHQHPTNGCESEFRWEDDPGYVLTKGQYGEAIPNNGKYPGLYTFLGGPPNKWPHDQVDFNLRQLPESSAYTIGPFDRNSIMKYFFPEWMFRSGTNSACYTPTENARLSDGDKAGVARVYPFDPPAIRSVMETRQQALHELSLGFDLQIQNAIRLNQGLKELENRKR